MNFSINYKAYTKKWSYDLKCVYLKKKSNLTTQNAKQILHFPLFISLSGYVFMVSMDTVIKVLGSNYPILQLLFLNALFSLIPLIFLLLKIMECIFI